jgi:hypothetical protein
MAVRFLQTLSYRKAFSRAYATLATATKLLQIRKITNESKTLPPTLWLPLEKIASHFRATEQALCQQDRLHLPWSSHQ